MPCCLAVNTHVDQLPGLHTPMHTPMPQVAVCGPEDFRNLRVADSMESSAFGSATTNSSMREDEQQGNRRQVLPSRMCIARPVLLPPIGSPASLCCDLNRRLAYQEEATSSNHLQAWRFFAARYARRPDGPRDYPSHFSQ